MKETSAEIFYSEFVEKYMRAVCASTKKCSDVKIGACSPAFS